MGIGFGFGFGDGMGKLGSNVNQSIVLTKTDSYLYFGTSWDEQNDLINKVEIKRLSSFSNNNNIRFIQNYLIKKNDNVDNVFKVLKDTGDDVCPAYVNNSYIGANHSWNFGYKIISTSHAKTVSDVGSIYSDVNSVNFTILRIINDNELWVVSENRAINEYDYAFIQPSGTLTYVSSGENTGSITVSSSSVIQLYSTLKKVSETILMNGQAVISTNGKFTGSFFDVIDVYDVLDLPSLITQLNANRPTAGYLEQPKFNEIENVDSLFQTEIKYRFYNNGTVLVFTKIIAKKSLKLGFHGFVQSIALTDGYVYVPKSLPITKEEVTYTLSKLTPWSSAPVANLILNTDYWEIALSPPDRVINKNDDVSIHLGYITDRFIQTNRKNIVQTQAIWLATNKKLYPMGIGDQVIMETNDAIENVSFVSYTNPTLNPSGRTNYNYFDIDSDTFVFVDYHGALNDNITAKKEWVGRPVSVYETNNNCTYLGGNVVSDSIEIASTATTDNYGFIVLKIGSNEFEPELSHYLDGLETELSSGQIVNIDSFLKGIKKELKINLLSGAFDVMYILGGENSESSLRNLVKNSHHATAINSPMFTQFEGFQGNGTNQYLKSNFKLSDSEIINQNDISAGIYIRTNKSANEYDFGAQVTSTRGLSLISRALDGNLLCRVNGLSAASAVTNSLGMSIISRNNASYVEIYKDNHYAKIDDNFAQTYDDNLDVSILGRNYNGTITYGTRQASFFFIGKSLTADNYMSIMQEFDKYMVKNGKSVL